MEKKDYFHTGWKEYMTNTYFAYRVKLHHVTLHI